MKKTLAELIKKERRKTNVAVDIVILTKIDEELNVLLIKRKKNPFKDCRAIPGGHLEIPEEWG